MCAMKHNRFLPAYDAVVVGAGMGGLSAGLGLAVGGAKVLVLERHNLPGGLATSFVRGRYEFEATLHELCDFGDTDNEGGVRRYLMKEAGIDVEFVRVPEAYHLICEEQDINVYVPFGTEEFIKAVESVEPGVGNQERMRKFMELCQDIMNAMVYLDQTKGNPDPSVMLKKYSAFLQTAPYTVDEVLNSFGFTDKAKQVIVPYWCYQGLNTEVFNFTVFASMINKYFTLGAYIPKMRSHRLSLAMQQKIIDCHGQVELNTTVSKILVKNGKTEGVQLDDGTVIHTKNVVSNLLPSYIYSKMMDPAEVPERALKTIGARTYGPSAFVVYLGLDATPGELHIGSYEYFIAPHMHTRELYEGCHKWAPPMIQSAICLDRAIPGATGPDRCQLSMTGLMFGDDAMKEVVNPLNYFSSKDELANHLIDQYERATGATLRGHIEEIEIATPSTWARYSNNYRGGIYGYEQPVQDSILTRTMARKDDEYIEGLDFVGAGSSRGHGYNSSISSGRSVSALILKKLGRG